MINTTENRWVSIPRPSYNAHIRLFCIPYAGGGSSPFFSWLQKLPSTIELCPVLLPGREARLREQLFSDLILLVNSIATGLYPYLNRPFAFFGHSMGAVVAFELARKIRRHNGLLPVHLFVSGHRAPHLPDLNRPIRNLSDIEFIEQIKKYNGTPESVFNDQELLNIFLPILRADFAIIETYRFTFESALDCPITAFGGLGDPRNSQPEIEAWKEHTRKSFNSHYFQGGHFFINQNQNELLKIVANDLVG